MLGIYHQRGRRRETELGADPRLSGGQRGGAVPVPGLGRVVRMEEPDIAPEGLPKRIPDRNGLLSSSEN